MAERIRAMQCCAAVAAILTVAGCGAFVSGSKATEAAVRNDANAIVGAYNAHDPAKAASYDAPDYVGMFHGSANVAGPAADEAGMTAQLKDQAAKWTIGEGKATVSGDGTIAVYEAPYAFTYTFPATGEVAHDYGNWIAIFKRQPDGAMKLWRSIGTDVPAPARP